MSELQTNLKPGDLVTGVDWMAIYNRAYYPDGTIFEVMGNTNNECLIHPEKTSTLLVWAPTSSLIKSYTEHHVNCATKKYKLGKPNLPKLKLQQFFIAHLILDTVNKCIY